MKTETIKHILKNKEKHDIFYDNRLIWIQELNEAGNIARVGFVDNFEEKYVNIEDLYKKNIYNL